MRNIQIYPAYKHYTNINSYCICWFIRNVDYLQPAAQIKWFAASSLEDEYANKE